MSGIVPRMRMTRQSISLPFGEIIERACHTCLTFVSFGHTLSSQTFQHQATSVGAMFAVTCDVLDNILLHELARKTHQPPVQEQFDHRTCYHTRHLLM